MFFYGSQAIFQTRVIGIISFRLFWCFKAAQEEHLRKAKLSAQWRVLSKGYRLALLEIPFYLVSMLVLMQHCFLITCYFSICN